jgi:polyhydroxyalkanoate synthesis regulator phasin
MATKTKTKTVVKKAINKSEGALRQSLLLGLGLFDLSREKIEKYVATLQKDLPTEARKKAVDNFLKSVKSNSKDIEAKTRTHIKKTLDQLSAKVAKSKKK